MDLAIKNYLLNIELGKLKKFKRMSVIPLSVSSDPGPEYITLKEGLDKKQLKVKEISHGGSVPELKVINSAEISILIIEGEELFGAKQNRVLNTTILLKKKSETVIPVSCTEQGRWSYISEEFADSGVMMASNLRAMSASSVSASLEFSREYRSDQGAIWDGIHRMSESAEVRSSTGAMRDIYKSMMKDLNEYTKAFPCQKNQRGMLVLINGEVVGFDILSQASAYKMFHPKLVRSYAMDAILHKKDKAMDPDVDKAKAFIKKASDCKEKKYDSVGHGKDHRFQGKKIVGSALVYQDKIIHIAFFRAGGGWRRGRMSGYRREG